MLSLNETIDNLGVANTVCCCVHVLTRENGHILRKALDFAVEGQREKRRLNRTWKDQVVKESMKVGLSREDALSQSNLIVGIDVIAIQLR